MTREVRKYSECNESKNRTYQCLENTAKVVFRGKFKVLNIFIGK